jgi:hypothetical protein
LNLNHKVISGSKVAICTDDKEYEDNKLLKRENMLKARNIKLKTDFKKRILQTSKPAIPACSPRDG